VSAIAIAAGLSVQPPGHGPPRLFHEAYELERGGSSTIGRGSFASVQAVRRRGASVAASPALAAKVISLHEDRDLGGGICARRCKKVWREVEIARMVRGKEHILQFEEALFEAGLAYIVMERCDRTLVEAVESLPTLTESSLKRFFHQMLQGIAALHDAGVVHRDVKPDNFLCFGPNSIVKLCDFGLSTIIRNQDTEGICGTPPYMAPEMVQYLRYSWSVDIWSMGALAYVFLFGEFPYRLQEYDPRDMKAAIATGCPAPTFRPSNALQDAGVQCPSPAATGFLRTALSRRPQDRFTARAALESDFFAEPHLERHAEGSLAAALESAKNLGAFDLPDAQPNPGEGCFRRLERRVAQLQATVVKSGALAMHPPQRACRECEPQSEGLAEGISAAASTCATTPPGSLAANSEQRSFSDGAASSGACDTQVAVGSVGSLAAPPPRASALDGTILQPPVDMTEC